MASLKPPTSKPPVEREEHGFRRTACGCELCKVHCRHLPGALDPSDLARLCPLEHDLFTWAEQHLRALTDKPYPTLVPARQPNSHCHWYFDGQCAVHDVAPYSCAFFDSHMAEDEVTSRVAATAAAIRQDATANGFYARVWQHLCRKGLIGRPGDRGALFRELHEIDARLGRCATVLGRALPVVRGSDAAS
jgi:hypothetical protein